VIRIFPMTLNFFINLAAPRTTHALALLVQEDNF
jgi:hypothetical protein